MIIDYLRELSPNVFLIHKMMHEDLHASRMSLIIDSVNISREGKQGALLEQRQNEII